MIDRPVLKKGHGELMCRKRGGKMMGQAGGASHRRERPWAAAFVRGCVGIADAQRKVRIVVKKEGRDVVVINDKQNVRFLVRQPLPDRFIAFKNWRPDWIV